MKHIDPLLDLNEVRDLTRVSYSTIYRLRIKGLFPEPLHLFERKLVWRKGDIEKFIAGTWFEKTNKNHLTIH